MVENSRLKNSWKKYHNDKRYERSTTALSAVATLEWPEMAIDKLGRTIVKRSWQ